VPRQKRKEKKESPVINSLRKREPSTFGPEKKKKKKKKKGRERKDPPPFGERVVPKNIKKKNGSTAIWKEEEGKKSKKV